MVNEAVVLKTIADLKMQTKPSYNATFKKFKINYKMLQQHFKNEIALRSMAQIKIQKLFYII